MEQIFIKESSKSKLLSQELFDAQIDGVTGVKIVDKKVIVYQNKKLSTENQQILEDLITNHDPTTYVYPLVMDLVEEQYNALPIKKVDFTLHLRPEIILTKSLTKTPNGRPQTAEYFYEGQKICEITWVFYDAPGGLFFKKEIYLSYMDSHQSLMDRFLIGKKEINFSIPNQLSESIQERVEARSAIVDEIKAVCSGAIQVALGISLEQVVMTILPFWNTYETERKNFIEMASRDWLNTVLAIDEDAVGNEWMKIPVDLNGTTCRQYMLYRLGY